jgi:hypothetical protein
MLASRRLSCTRRAAWRADIPYCRQRVKQGPVLYVAAERGAVVKRRVKAWCLEHGVSDIPLAVIDQAVDLRSGKFDADRIIATATEVAAICGKPVFWIIIDTLNRVLAGGDENGSKDMGAVIAAVDHIHRATQAHCSLIHHVPVDRNDRMRGHGSVLGAVDMTVRVTKDAFGIVHVETDAAKDLVDKPRFAFTFKSVTLCTDPDTGVDTTAPVMVATEVATKPKERKLPKAAQITLRALQEAVAELGTVPPASNHIPAGQRVVSVEQWRKYAYAHDISSGETERARQVAFQRASRILIAGHHVGVWNEQAWPAAKISA